MNVGWYMVGEFDLKLEKGSMSVSIHREHREGIFRRYKSD